GVLARQPMDLLFSPRPDPTEEWLKRIYAYVGVERTPGPGAMDLYNQPEAIPVLIDLLRYRDPHVRGMAAYFLKCLDPQPREAVPALLQAWQRCKDHYCSIPGPGGLLRFDEARAAICIHDTIVEIDPDAAREAGILVEPPGPHGDSLD